MDRMGHYTPSAGNDNVKDIFRYTCEAPFFNPVPLTSIYYTRRANLQVKLVSSLDRPCREFFFSKLGTKRACRKFGLGHFRHELSSRGYDFI